MNLSDSFGLTQPMMKVSTFAQTTALVNFHSSPFDARYARLSYVLVRVETGNAAALGLRNVTDIFDMFLILRNDEYLNSSLRYCDPNRPVYPAAQTWYYK